VRNLGEAGYLHRLGGGLPPVAMLPVRRRSAGKTDPARVAKLSSEFVDRITDKQIIELSARLGVSGDSLKRLGIGWNGAAYTFPMQNGAGEIIGVCRRYPDGTKRTLRNTRNGLFVPTGLSGIGFLLTVEGASDAAALLDLGFDAIGRPSCSGRTDYIRRAAHGRRVVIVGENDGPGKHGAEFLRTALARNGMSVRLIYPEGHEDIRGEINAGLTRDELDRRIASVPNFACALIPTVQRPTQINVIPTEELHHA